VNVFTSVLQRDSITSYLQIIIIIIIITKYNKCISYCYKANFSNLQFFFIPLKFSTIFSPFPHVEKEVLMSFSKIKAFVIKLLVYNTQQVQPADKERLPFLFNRFEQLYGW